MAVLLIGLVSVAHADTVTLGVVTGSFFTSNGSGVFNTPATATPAFTETFPQLNFNPPAGTVPSTNAIGVNVLTVPFTDVIQQPDGSTVTQVAAGNGHQAGLGDLTTFQAVFTAAFNVAVAGNVTFTVYSADGFLMGVGGGATRVSGSLINVPSSGTSPFNGYPVLGAYNQATAPTVNNVTINFSAPGLYPVEFDYSKSSLCCLTFTVLADGSPIQSIQAVPGPIAGAGLSGLIFTIAGVLAWWRKKRKTAFFAA